MADGPAVRMVDLNRILRWINAIIAGVTVVVYLQIGGNDYIDTETIVLATLLALQNHVALLVERRRRDPFVILLTFILILYYSLRVFTLLVFPFSFVLDRFPYAPSDSNHALLFILLANTFLYAGFYAVRGGTRLRVDVGQWRPTAPSRALLLVVTTIIFIYMKGILWNPESIPRALQFLLIFLSQNIVLLLALTYYLVFRQAMSRAYAGALLALLVLEMLLHSLAGSRSAFIYSLQNVLLVILAVRGSVPVPRKLVLVGLAILPLAMVFLVAAFTISTFIRASTATGEPFSPSATFELSRATGERLSRDYALEAGLPVMLSRAGFFDYSAEVLAHSREYAEVINVSAYGRSIIDNLLTPGFDIFDQPKISNSLQFVYSGKGKPSKVVSAAEYQSDQLGIYGELYVLFGYASLPLFFTGAFLIKHAYMALHDANPFVLTIKRVVTLYMFAVIVNSFGLDWALMEFLPLVVAIYIYRYFFAGAPDQSTSRDGDENSSPSSAARSRAAFSRPRFQNP